MFKCFNCDTYMSIDKFFTTYRKNTSLDIIDFIKNNNLPNDVHNKAIQKICESQRIDKETKTYLKEIKK